jgi:hypothetical protein
MRESLMKTKAWLWKIGEVVLVIVLGIYILLPGHYEDELIVQLYARNPVFCIFLGVATAMLFIAVGFHRIDERRTNKIKRQENTPYRGTL